MKKFYLKDRVRMSHPQSIYYGRVGTVVGDRHPLEGMVMVNFDNDPSSPYDGYAEYTVRSSFRESLDVVARSRAAKAEPMFKVGDRVKNVAYGSAYSGEEGRITNVSPLSPRPYTVQWEGAMNVHHYSREEVEPVAASTENENENIEQIKADLEEERDRLNRERNRIGQVIGNITRALDELRK